MIGFFKDTSSKEALAFLATAENHDSLSFGISSSQEVADQLGATLDSIILYKPVGVGVCGCGVWCDG